MNYVFLGTPQVAACALKELLLHKTLPCGEDFSCVAVVSQPPSRSQRGKGNTPSPVHQLAAENKITVLCPESAKDPEFIAELVTFQPHLCITAAYGQVLSEDFLKIPKFGTLNIHPSLLPAYRGAAPVQRALEAGEKHTGVTVLQTVRRMDAGPIAWQERFSVDNEIKADELLEKLFLLGAKGTLETAEKIALGNVKYSLQDEALVTHAKKLNVEEAWLDFSLDPLTLHNKVRAFSVWPGTKMKIRLSEETLECKVLSSRAPPEVRHAVTSGNSPQYEQLLPSLKISLSADKGALTVPCGNGGFFEVVELQLPGRKKTTAKDFWNGLKDKSIKRIYRALNEELNLAKRRCFDSNLYGCSALVDSQLVRDSYWLDAAYNKNSRPCVSKQTFLWPDAAAYGIARVYVEQTRTRRHRFVSQSH